MKFNLNKCGDVFRDFLIRLGHTSTSNAKVPGNIEELREYKSKDHESR